VILQAEQNPDALAVVMGGSGEAVTYGELEGRSRALAGFLSGRGLKRGDRLAVFMENHPRYFEVVWAGLRSGLYVVPVNCHLTAQEAGYIIADSGARAMVTTTSLGDVVNQIAPRDLESASARLMIGAAEGSFTSYEEAITEANQSGGKGYDHTSGAYLFYSSGTTGRPKGVLRPLPGTDPSRMDARTEKLKDLYGFRHDMVYLSPGPLYHAAPLGATVSTQRYGGTVVTMERFDPLVALSLVERHRVTHSQWVPTMFVRMLALSYEERHRYDVSSLEAAVHAAAPCPIDIKRRMIEWWGPILYEYYSATERTGQTYINSHEWLERPGSVGRPLTGQIHIIGEDEEELLPGEVGKIYFSGGESFSYLNDPEKTDATRLDGGLATMGDVGYVDQDGWLFLTDRTADLIISGGVNIYPREVEDVLMGHPAVLDVAVFGVPSTDLGEEVKAVVQLVPPKIAEVETEAELIAFCRERLASFKCPRTVDFVSELPREPNGKLYKRLLRDRYWGIRTAGATGVVNQVVQAVRETGR
jgi:fatty-acyl-CoA synthase